MIDPIESDDALTTIPGPSNRRRIILCLLAAALAVAAYAAAPSSLGELGRRTLAIFVFAAICWASEALPLYATSLCVVGLCTLLLAAKGGLANVGDLSYERFLAPFAHNVIILFMAGFLLSAAVQKHHVDRVIASRVLSPLVSRPALLLLAVLSMTAFFSMWMSNTATAAMMLAIIAPVLRSMPKGDKFHRAIILAVPFGANIGGIGTPIGTPPNAIALDALRKIGGVQITFLNWMMLAVPLAVLMILVTWGLLYAFFRPAAGLRIEPIARPGRLTAKGWLTGAILLVTATLWLTAQVHGIREAVVALLAAALLTALGILSRRDVDSIDWNVLILMWGGLALGLAMETTGLAAWIVNPLGSLSGLWLVVLVTATALLLSTFMSNTAAASLLIPMAMAIPGVGSAELALLAAFACSFAMAIPVSTPPNAMAFATGRIPATSMLRVGALISLIAAIVMLLGYQIMLPLVLGR